MTKQTVETEDFASAAMMRLVHAGLVRQGINPGQDRPRGAHVARTSKAQALSQVLDAHGPLAVLRTSEALPSLSHEPLLKALLLSQDLEDLMDRWARIAAFSHKRQWVKATVAGPGIVALQHLSRVKGETPSHAETLLLMGVLTMLAETALGAPARLEFSEGPTIRQNGAWSADALPEVIGTAHLTCHAPRAAAPLEDALNGAVVIDTLRDSLRSDPVRRWKIGDLARQSGLSVRSLQRKLAEQSISFSTLVAETRLEVAADHLCEPDGPGLSEIGFLAGFSDQAHFNRSFKQSVGTTPKSYRTEFQPS